MVSVSAERKDGKLRYRISFKNRDGKRKWIRLSQANKRTAAAIGSKVEALNHCRIAGESPSPSLSEWLVNLGDELYGKLATAGLVDARQSSTLRVFIDGYISSRNDVAERTRINWKMTRDKLTDFLGEDRELRSISVGDADDFRQWLADNHAEATLGGHVKRAKQFFKQAQRRNLVDANPFADIKGGRQDNRERMHFVHCEDIAKAVKHCPDAEWRLILALCRFGGLRCPSEVLRLTWADVDWQGKRFTVTSPKTAKQGKPLRVVPMFPELEPFLVEAFEQAADGAKYCVTRYRSQDANLRTQLERILKRAGVEPWDKLFQNLRSTRETELTEHFPLHVVTAWLGNTPQVASKHYLSTSHRRAFRSSIRGWHKGWHSILLQRHASC